MENAVPCCLIRWLLLQGANLVKNICSQPGNYSQILRDLVRFVGFVLV